MNKVFIYSDDIFCGNIIELNDQIYIIDMETSSIKTICMSNLVMSDYKIVNAQIKKCKGKWDYAYFAVFKGIRLNSSWNLFGVSALYKVKPSKYAFKSNFGVEHTISYVEFDKCFCIDGVVLLDVYLPDYMTATFTPLLCVKISDSLVDLCFKFCGSMVNFVFNLELDCFEYITYSRVDLSTPLVSLRYKKSGLTNDKFIKLQRFVAKCNLLNVNVYNGRLLPLI